MPHVAAAATPRLEAAGLARRYEVVAGDFFAALPSGGDVYILKNVIDSFEDDRAVRLLQNCHRAMAPHGKLLVVGQMIRPGHDPAVSKLLDLALLVNAGGPVRTEAELYRLFTAAGFRLTRIIPTQAATEDSIIEGCGASPSDNNTSPTQGWPVGVGGEAGRWGTAAAVGGKSLTGQPRAGAGLQCLLVPRSRCQGRLTHGVRCGRHVSPGGCMEEERPSTTAMIAAMIRAAHLLWDDAPTIFQDPLALGLSGVESPDALQATLRAKQAEPYNCASVLVRQRYAEDLRKLNDPATVLHVCTFCCLGAILARTFGCTTAHDYKCLGRIPTEA